MNNRNSSSSTSSAPLPDPVLLKKLIDMGIEERVARKALSLTNNESLELASSLALDLIDGDIEDDIPSYRMIFIVNGSLKMTTGEIALQVADSLLKMYHEIVLLGIDGKTVIDNWRALGEKKLVYKGMNDSHLQELSAQATGANLFWLFTKTREATPTLSEGALTILAIMGTEQDTANIIKKLEIL
ncbi:uncharacterized protein LOC106674391 [Cimex lectularius]|uniref:peptidyl-tRNA hydrolase n=1 Tax=Cimex lectularius TaxID=79782 RepID=A0A8I6SAI4_CIMLE|nr:uncharacterized protein LOC106674391 [Cimex lectularius]